MLSVRPRRDIVPGGTCVVAHVVPQNLVAPGPKPGKAGEFQRSKGEPFVRLHTPTVSCSPGAETPFERSLPAPTRRQWRSATTSSAEAPEAGP